MFYVFFFDIFAFFKARQVVGGVLIVFEFVFDLVGIV